MTNKQNILLVGTATDVGKTHVSIKLINKLKKQGFDAGYFKPVISGGIDDAKEICKETRIISGKKLAGSPLKAQDLVGLSFDHAYSPHFASRIENRPIELKIIQDRFERIRPLFELFVIEGCGGIFCPIGFPQSTRLKNSKADLVLLKDVFKLFEGRYFLVSPSGLGSLNDSILACEYGARNGMPIEKIILNRFDDKNPIHCDNKAFLEAWTGKELVSLATD